MRYLLDVNALISLGIRGHTFHTRVANCVNSLNSVRAAKLSTAPITELGFVRILSQPTPYGLTVADAKDLLKRLKATSPIRFTFLVDGNDISKLPSWVKLPKQTTDGHLVRLAKSNGAVLATLDSHIPDSFLIPV